MCEVFSVVYLISTKSAFQKCYPSAMRYIFYADVYFVQNFMMKLAVLYLALYCSKVNFETTRIKGIGKISIASFIGTIIEIVGLIFSGSYTIFVLCVHLFEVPLMSWFVLGKNCRQMLRVIISGYFFTILINGVLEALWNQFGEGGSYIFFLLFSCASVIAGVRIWKNYHRMQKGIFSVELSFRGNQVQTKAFYDSGNRLIDPYTKQGVHIVSEKLVKVLGIKSAIEGEIEENTPVYIPYQSLGNEADLLELYYIDELIVETEKQRKHIQNCPLGVTKDNLFEGKNYEIILSEEVF